MTAGSVDWNTLIDEYDEDQRVTLVELPPSPTSIEESEDNNGHHSDVSCEESVCSDVLDLGCSETDSLSLDNDDGGHSETTGKRRDTDKAEQCASTYETVCEEKRTTTGAKRAVIAKKNTRGGGNKVQTEVVVQRRSCRGQENTQRRRRKFKNKMMTRDQQSLLPPPRRQMPEQQWWRQNYSCVDRTTWTVRSIRSGYEQLVYYICNCNEAPNVVFAGLCYLQFDVYTMVLRNCNGKRRYWYDRPERYRRLPNGLQVDDFERAMAWRANNVGRASTSPGYDTAAFILQNVATDKRCDGVSPPPLIIVTADGMLSENQMSNQLLFEAKHRRQADAKRNRPSDVPCLVCGVTSGIVTQDNASVATFTCWRHSGPYLADTSATWTRVCNAVIVDMDFLRDDANEELVCQLRLVGAGNSQLTIAELVTRPPFYTQANGYVKQTDSNTAHSLCCDDIHRNYEDLFPSMPVVGGGNSGVGSVRFYDTTIGCVVDRMYCMVSTFQRV